MVDISENKMDTAYKKAIAGYLRGRSGKDAALAEAMKKEGKSLDGVLAYVKQEARKQQKDGFAFVTDEEVFEWVVHYILEDSLNCEPKKKEPKAEVTRQQVPVQLPQKKPKTIEQEVQLTLFDF